MSVSFGSQSAFVVKVSGGVGKKEIGTIVLGCGVSLDSPGGGSQSSDECLQQAAYEAVRVPPCHQEVEQRQDEEAVDEETHDD